MDVKIEPSWKNALEEEFGKPYFKELTEFVKKEYEENKVYPAPKNIFRAFELTSFDKVKVVILGQDPYHGAHQAIGLSFAVEKGVTLPPSLRNIYKELESDLGKLAPQQGGEKSAEVSGDLTRWAEQGVLLLNATLTVRSGQPGSHQGHGWEAFTDAAIQTISDKRENLVFILWGNYARSKAKAGLIDPKKHLIIESAHPSPFSAANGFFGSKPFSKTNAYLRKHGEQPIEWV